MGTKRKNKSKKGAKKKTSKHGRRCGCDECSEKKAGRKWNRRRTNIEKEKGQEERKLKASKDTIGFLSGGHQNLKRDLSFEKTNVFTEHLSNLHQKASFFIKKFFSSDGSYSKEPDQPWPFPGMKTPEPLGGCKLTRAYQVDLDSSAFDALKVKARVDFLWHGTSFFNISSIGHSSLATGNHGLLGGGIYLTPNFLKAWGYTGSWNWNYRQSSNSSTVLLCAVKLGKVLDSKECMKHAKDCGKLAGLEAPVRVWGKCSKDCKWTSPNASEAKKRGCNTSAAMSGGHPGAYGGHLRFSEYCCYNEAQVLPLYALVFSKEN